MFTRDVRRATTSSSGHFTASCVSSILRIQPVGLPMITFDFRQESIWPRSRDPRGPDLTAVKIDVLSLAVSDTCFTNDAIVGERREGDTHLPRWLSILSQRKLFFSLSCGRSS